MGKQTEGCEDFKKHINAPTKKDPRKGASYDHDKAFEEIKGQSTPIKTKVKGKLKF